MTMNQRTIRPGSTSGWPVCPPRFPRPATCGRRLPRKSGTASSGATHGRRARRRGWLPLAAASLAAAAVALGSLYLGQRSGPMDHSPVAVNGSSPAPFGPGHDLGARHQAARAGLAEGLERRLAALPPETRAAVEQNLDTIRRAAAEINTALGDDPANLFLQHQLLSVYQDELNVLGNIQRVTEPLSTRNDI
jgi:hypothetical protein